MWHIAFGKYCYYHHWLFDSVAALTFLVCFSMNKMGIITLRMLKHLPKLLYISEDWFLNILSYLQSHPFYTLHCGAGTGSIRNPSLVSMGFCISVFPDSSIVPWAWGVKVASWNCFMACCIHRVAKSRTESDWTELNWADLILWVLFLLVLLPS